MNAARSARGAGSPSRARKEDSQVQASSPIPTSRAAPVRRGEGATRPDAGTHQLVVGGVVVDVEDTSLVSGVLGAPGEVTGVQAERAELLVAATAAHDADVGGLRELGVGGLTAELVPEEE